MEAPAGDDALSAIWTRLAGLEQKVSDLETRVRELEMAGTEFRRVLNRLGDALAATHDRPAMLSAVLETCALYLGTTAAVFYAAVAGSDRLRPITTYGLAEGTSAPELASGEGLAGAASASGSVVVWPGGTAEPAGSEPCAGEGAAMAVPVRTSNRPFGVLALYGRATGRPFADEDVDALATLTRQVETAIEMSFLYEEASRLAITDGLTSLWNRRQFDLRMAEELYRAIRFHEPVSVVLLDLDQMKAVNDSRGHQAGDALLIELAHRLTSGVRDVDLVARYGGDEFALILPNTGVAGALRLGDKVRGRVADQTVDVGTGEPVAVTVSVGVASFPEHGTDKRSLVDAADRALYRAKAGGGNRVEHAKVGG